MALLEALAEEFQRCEDYLLGAKAETNPATATHTLPEWEAKYGLESTGTTDERRLRIRARRAVRRRTRPDDYKQRFGAILGIDPLAVGVLETSRAQAAAMGFDRSIYRFHIYRDPSLPGTYSVADAQALLDSFSQSHTLGKIIESTVFRCDDPHSLCDRDVLELPGFSAGFADVGPGEGFFTVDEDGFLEVS